MGVEKAWIGNKWVKRPKVGEGTLLRKTFTSICCLDQTMLSKQSDFENEVKAYGQLKHSYSEVCQRQLSN